VYFSTKQSLRYSATTPHWNVLNNRSSAVGYTKPTFDSHSTYVMDPNVKYLTDEEIKQFLKELDSDNDGLIAYHEVETKLDEVSREIGKNKTYSAFFNRH
jgi:Ca2+-binding EF-hand superfamily protein